MNIWSDMMKITKWSDARLRAVKPDDESHIQRAREAMRVELRSAACYQRPGVGLPLFSSRLGFGE